MHQTNITSVSNPCPYCRADARADTMNGRYWVWCINNECSVQPRTNHYTTLKQALDIWDLPYQKGEEPVSQEIKILISKYVKCREALDAKRQEWTKIERSGKEYMEKIVTELHNMMKSQGTKQFKIETDDGVNYTAFEKMTDFVAVADWTETLPFIIKNNLLHMFNKAVNKSAVKEYMETNDGAVPPGLQYGAKVEVQIRKT